MYLTDEQIRQLFIVKVPNKTPNGFDVYANGYIGTELDPTQLNVCFTGESINPRFARLFVAAPVLYQTMHAQLESMVKFEEALKSVGAKALAADVGNMAEALRMGLAMATDGVEEAHKRVIALQVLQATPTQGKAN